MAIHIQDKETDALVRDFARRRGIGITAAIRIAVKEASSREKERLEDVLRRIEPILAEIRVRRTGGFEEAQRFIDEGWDET